MSERWNTIARLLGILAVAVFTLAGTASSAQAEVLVPELPQRTAPDLKKARAEAKKNYDMAAKALGEGNGKEALLYAKIAYATLPNASTAALLCIALRENGQEKDAFYHCLVGLSLKPSNDEKRLINSTIADLGRAVKMGWADVQVDPADAQVEISGAKFKGSRVVGLSAGDHTLAVSREGYKPRSMSVNITEGIQVPAILALSQNAIKTTSTVQVETEPTWMTYAGWSFVGVGGALVIAGVGIQLAGLSASSEEDLSDEEAAAYNVQTGVLAGIGGALAVTGIILVVLDPGEKKEVKVGDATLDFITPSFNADGASVNLGLSF